MTRWWGWLLVPPTFRPFCRGDLTDDYLPFQITSLLVGRMYSDGIAHCVFILHNANVWVYMYTGNCAVYIHVYKLAWRL